MVTLAICAVAAVIGVASIYIFNQPADNPVEKAAENVIEAELGLPQNSIDLTPGSTAPVVAEAEAVGAAALQAGEAALVANTKISTPAAAPAPKAS